MIGYLTREQAEALLITHSFGRIGCNDGFNTYIYPSNYVFEGNYIFCHSLPGAKINVMRQNNRVCLQVDEVRGFEHWKSVMVQGLFEEIEDARERYHAIKIFAGRSMHPKISEEVILQEGRGQSLLPGALYKMKLIIYRITIEEITGRVEYGS